MMPTIIYCAKRDLPNSLDANVRYKYNITEYPYSLTPTTSSATNYIELGNIKDIQDHFTILFWVILFFNL